MNPLWAVGRILRPANPSTFTGIAANGSQNGLFARSDHQHGYPQLSSAPGSPVEGQVYYDTVLHTIRWYNGTIWQSPSPLTVDRVGYLAINNDASEQTLYTYTIPANSLGSSGAYRLTLLGNHLNNMGGNRQFTLRMTYGSTTMFGDLTGNISSTASRRAWRCEVDLLAYGATNAQRLNAKFALGANTAGSVAGTGNLGGTDTIPLSVLAGDAAEDSTTALALAVTVQHSAADVNLEIVRTFAWLEKLS